MSRIIPNKKLGQVFLKNRRYLQKIIETGEISDKDIVIEIGPGTGILTEALIQTGAKIIAIEKDPRLVKFLENRFKNTFNLQIIQGDIRDIFNLNSKKILDSKFQIPDSKFKVIGNIPYYLTSYLIQLLLELKNKPRIIVLMVQKEVAERIIAQPPQMNILAIAVQFYAQPKIICPVPKSTFWPKPKVDSAIIKLIPYHHPLIVNKAKQFAFFKVIKAGFSHPRKLLINNLNKKLSLPKQNLQNIFTILNINQNARPQELSLNQWQNLTLSLLKNKNIV